MCETVKIDLFDVLTTDGKVKTEEFCYYSDVFDMTGEEYQVTDKGNISLKFENIEQGHVRLKGKYRIGLSIPCSRCLEPVGCEVEDEFDTELVSLKEPSDEDETEDISFLQGNEFNVSEFIDQSVLMNMPSKVLCREDCKGLCPVCGNNLNDHDCGCDSFVPDPRMAILSDIFNANKEV